MLGGRRQGTLAAAALALLLVACEGRIDDPAGDGQGVDALEAGVDYRSTETHLWIRFASDGGRAQHVWAISTDGDTTADMELRLGGSGAGTGGGGDYYELVRSSDHAVQCSGFAVNQGERISVRVDSRCFAPNPRTIFDDHALPPNLRFTASSSAHRTAYDAFASWSAPIPLS